MAMVGTWEVPMPPMIFAMPGILLCYRIYRMRLFRLLWLLAVFPLTCLGQTAGRIIVPYPPGGSLDAMARVMAGKLADATGRSYVVENRTGAAGAIGSASVKGGPTDGSLLLFAPDSNISVYPFTVAKPAYVPL